MMPFIPKNLVPIYIAGINANPCLHIESTKAKPFLMPEM